MKLWAWLKSLSLIAVLGMIGAAIMMVWRAHAAGKLEANIKHEEAELKKLQAGTVEEIQEAALLQDYITDKKIRAREVRKKSEASLERIGQHETMADIALRFNGKRVRHRSDPAPIFPGS